MTELNSPADTEPNAVPDAIPDTVPDAIPYAVPDAAPETVPYAVPDAATYAAPYAVRGTAPDAVPGAGSAIFVHIWRANGDKPTSGCTAMAAQHLEDLLSWLDPQAKPVFVLLPESAHHAVYAQWGLPAPDESPPSGAIQ